MFLHIFSSFCCLQDKTWVKMPKWTISLMSSKEFVLITEIFWHIFWRTFCLHYLTLYKTPATGLFPKNQTFFYGGLNSAMFALLTHLRHPNYHNFMIYECFCINKILFTFFQLLKTSFNWEHFCWLTNRKFVFSTKSKQKNWQLYNLFLTPKKKFSIHKFMNIKCCIKAKEHLKPLFNGVLVLIYYFEKTF